MICTLCGTRNQGSAFCTLCGGNLAVATAAPAAAGPAVAPSTVWDLTADFELPAFYAGFWRRAAATLIDGAIVMVASWLLSGVLVGSLLASVAREIQHSAFDSPQESLVLLLLFRMLATAGASGLPMAILSWLYVTTMESSSARGTFGKQILGIRVTGMNGDRISFARANARFFSKILSAFLFCAGYILAAFTPRKQALHDLIAGTVVVRG